MIVAPAVARTAAHAGGASSSKDHSGPGETTGAGREPVPPVPTGAERELEPPVPAEPQPAPGKKPLDPSHFPKDSRCETCTRCKMQ